MASFEMRKDGSEKEPGGSMAPDSNGEALEPHRETGERPPRRRVLDAAERERMLKRAREISFPVGMRGYDRGAVDRYVETMNRTIAELEMSSSPESAVRHALDELSDETREILQQAHHAADEITTRSRAKADDRLQEAERQAQRAVDAAQQGAEETHEAALHEAQEIRDAAKHDVAELRETAIREITELRTAAASESQRLQIQAQRDADKLLGDARREASEVLERAETRAQELSRSADTIWHERRRLVDDIRAVGEQLGAIAESEGKRFAHPGDGAAIGSEDGHADGAMAAAAPQGGAGAKGP